MAMMHLYMTESVERIARLKKHREKLRPCKVYRPRSDSISRCECTEYRGTGDCSDCRVVKVAAKA